MSGRRSRSQSGPAPNGGEKLRAVIYTRVSSKDQIENFSLSTQEKACRDFCERNGLEVVEVFEERGESAKTANRPELQRMLVTCTNRKNRIGVVVVLNLSRLDRQTHDHVSIKALLKKPGVMLRSVTEQLDDSPVGKFTENVIVAANQFDNDIKALRTRMGMEAGRERGRWQHQAPLGYLNGRQPAPHPSLVVDQATAPLVKQAFLLVASGMSRPDALRRIRALGLRARGGGELSAQTFHHVLRNHAYRAWIADPVHPASGYRGDWEPIVDDGLFWIVYRRLNPVGPTSVEVRRRDNPNFPLKGVVRCGQCGSNLTGGDTVKSRTARRYPYYECFRKDCRGVRIRKYALEDEFDRLLSAVNASPEVLPLFKEIVLDVWRTRRADTTTLREELRRREGDVLLKKDRIFDAFDAGRIDESTYRRQADRADADLAQIEAERAKLADAALDVKDALEYAVTVLRDPGRLWKQFMPVQRHRFFRVVFPEGVQWTGEGFRTPVTGPVFSWFGGLTEGERKGGTPSGIRTRDLHLERVTS